MRLLQGGGGSGGVSSYSHPPRVAPSAKFLLIFRVTCRQICSSLWMKSNSEPLVFFTEFFKCRRTRCHAEGRRQGVEGEWGRSDVRSRPRGSVKGCRSCSCQELCSHTQKKRGNLTTEIPLLELNIPIFIYNSLDFFIFVIQLDR